MKLRALAFVLALALTLSAVPVTAQAAAPLSVPEPIVAPAALPELAAPQAKTYSITLTCSGNGKAELYATSAGARESVYFLADPAPGYKVSFEKCGYYKEQYDLKFYYIGNNVYEIVMPDGDVMLNLEFVKIESASHKVKLTVSAGGKATVDQTAAKKGECLFVSATPAAGYSLKSVRARSGGNWLEGYYLGREGSASLYEVHMPDDDAEILVDFTRNGPYSITPCIDTPGGTVTLSHKTAYELEKVTITAKPNRGYQVTKLGCSYAQVTKVKENVWSFPMPKSAEEVHVSFAPVLYPTSVTVEHELGGRAYLDMEGAVIGTTVKLTCLPDEGYRVAQITGASLTDCGNNTYTFVMDNAPVELRVLFLRENNPFLDVNETNFFYDSVLWAVENGITSGIDDTHFGPTVPCSRAQVVFFLWRAAGSPAPTGTANPFSDVADGAWYTNAVLWAVEAGITAGADPTHFNPGGVCSRAQVVTFLHRANGSPTPKLEENPFTDVPVGSWYTVPVLWALENGITSGTSQTTFSPGNRCLRGQVVTFLYHAEQLPEPEPLPFPNLEK